MNQTITCPACTLRLTLPAEHMGRQVRCPSCGAAFTAGAEAPPPPPAPASSGGAFPNLSLDEDGPSSSPGAPQPREEAPPPPSRREEPPPAERRSPSRRRDRDDRDDYDDEEEDRPWERPYRRRVRRDCEPHRGSLVLTFGIISLVAIALCAPIGLPFGIMAWWMGSADLPKIRAGTMDPEGEGSTQAGWVCGIIGTIIDGLWFLGCLAYFGFIFFMIFAAASSTPPSRPRPPGRFLVPDMQPRLEKFLPGPMR